MGERFRGVLSRVGSPPVCLALAGFLASRSSNNSRDPFGSVFFLSDTWKEVLVVLGGVRTNWWKAQ